MTESVLQVNGLLTAGCARNVEKALLRLPGVHHASANYLNSTATVHYDEAQVSPAQLQAAVADCGYLCAGEAAPEHMAQGGRTMDHAAHAAHGAAQTAHVARAMPAVQPQAVDHTAHAGHAPAAGAVEDHSAHGGRAGMTAADMERDMRNRFFASLVLTVPVFLFSHLATQILGLHLTLPFGLSDKLFGSSAYISSQPSARCLCRDHPSWSPSMPCC